MSEEEPELYLVLHKVRGKPAFDIAHKLLIGDTEGWIIPTSGHRAYPYWFILAEDLYIEHDFPDMKRVCRNIPDMPSGHPDHYSCNDRKTHEPLPSGSLAQRLGLVPKAPVINRRI